MFGPTPFSPLNTTNSYAGSLGARSKKDDPEDDITHPEPPPIWKQVMTIVALHGLIATVETLGRRVIHRLFDGPDGPKAEGSQPMIMMLAPDGDEDDKDKEEGTTK